MANLILLRHGESLWNEKNLFTGWVDVDLTDKGRDLLPVLISLRQWGEKWVSEMPSNPVLVDARHRLPIQAMAVRAADGRALSLGEMEWVDRTELPRD